MPFLFLCTAFMIGLSLQHVRLFTAFHCRIAALPWRSTASRCPFHRPSLACRCSITAFPPPFTAASLPFLGIPLAFIITLSAALHWPAAAASPPFLHLSLPHRCLSLAFHWHSSSPFPLPFTGLPLQHHRVPLPFVGLSDGTSRSPS